MHVITRWSKKAIAFNKRCFYRGITEGTETMVAMNGDPCWRRKFIGPALPADLISPSDSNFVEATWQFRRRASSASSLLRYQFEARARRAASRPRNGQLFIIIGKGLFNAYVTLTRARTRAREIAYLYRWPRIADPHDPPRPMRLLQAFVSYR